MHINEAAEKKRTKNTYSMSCKESIMTVTTFIRHFCAAVLLLVSITSYPNYYSCGFLHLQPSYHTCRHNVFHHCKRRRSHHHYHHVDNVRTAFKLCSSSFVSSEREHRQEGEDNDDNERDYAGEELLDWMEDSETSFVGPVEVKESTVGYGLGLFVTEDIDADKILLEIPRKKCVALDNHDDDEDENYFLSLDPFPYDNDDDAVNYQRGKLAGKLSFEYLQVMMHDQLLSKETTTTMTTVPKHDNEISSSDFEPYLRLLPFSNCNEETWHVLHWSNEEVETLFEGSIAYREVCSIRHEVDKAIHILQPHVRSKLDSILDNSNLVISNDEIDNAIKSSFVSILSRSFEDDETNGSKCIPVLDMCNHSSNGGNIMHGTDSLDGTVVVYTKTELKAGMELRYSYDDDGHGVATEESGENIKYDNDLMDGEKLKPYQFFILYGFIPNVMTDVRELLRTKSPLFFPS